MVIGSAVEAIGAFGYDETGGHAIPALTYLHNSSWPADFLGLFLVLSGIVLAIGSRLQRLELASDSVSNASSLAS